MSDDAVWMPVVSFPDQSGSFVHGFEAGQMWEAMCRSDPEITKTIHAENEEIVRRMADHQGYEIERFQATSVEGWADVELRKTRPSGQLRVIK